MDSLRISSHYWRATTREQALEELASVAGQMASAGLLQVPGSKAIETAARLKELKGRRWFEQGFAKTLYFRKALLDPDDLLDRLLPWVSWVFKPAVLWSLMLFVAAVFFGVIWSFDRLLAQGGNFFTILNLGMAWLLFLLVKVIHEFGHGLTAKRYGAEVHEMGFMFIVFAPYLFCNVSDAWRLDKSARMAIGAAGIVIEMVIAAVAALLWLLTQPGLFNQMCFNLMVLCSISTILLNGNPLLKFDGYYILADLCEIPNLRDKSNAWITNWAQRHLLGLPVPPVRSIPGEVGVFFGFYAVSAYIYTWVLLFAISAMLFNLLEPYGLQFLSRAYVFVFLFISVALPLYRLGQTVRMSPHLRRAASKRMLVGAGAALVALLLVFLVPWRDEIKSSAVLEQTQVQAVSAASPGFLRRVDVREGQFVARGQLLAVLENADLETELEVLRLERESLEVRLRSLAAAPGEEARLAVPVLQRQLAELDAQLAGSEQRWRSLELRSPLDGVVRTPRPHLLVGKLFPARQPVLQVGQSSVPRVVIALDEKEARRVHPGQPLKVVFDSFPGEIFYGTVTSVPASPATRFTAPSMANLFGGEVPSEMDTATQLPVPTMPHYEVEASMSIPPAILEHLRPQSSGRANIRVNQTSLAAWIRDRFLESIHPDVRL